MKRTLQFALLGALFACPVMASASSGIIHFRGAIVEEACRIKPDEASVHVSCYRDGKHQRETQPLVSYMKINMMQSIASTQLYPVAGHPDLQILQVTYR